MKFKQKQKIRQRVLAAVVGCCLISLCLYGVVSLIGVLSLRNEALGGSGEIGRQAADYARDVLGEQQRGTLLALADSNADQVDLQMGQLRDNVQLLSREMTRIATYPEQYREQAAYPPRHGTDGQLTAYLTFAPDAPKGISPTEFQREIALTANIQDLLLDMQSTSPLVEAAYVGSRHGFMLQADEKAEGAFSSPEAAEADPFDATERPWFLQAKAENKVIFTDVSKDYYSAAPTVVCAAPYYAGGEFAGAVGMDCFLQEIEQAVLDSKVGEYDISFVMNAKGQIIFSTEKEGELAVLPMETDTAVRDVRQSENSSLADMAKKIAAGERGTGDLEVDGRRYFAAYVPMKNVAWSFVLCQDYERFLAPVNLSQTLINQYTADKMADMDRGIWHIGIILGVLAAVLAALAAFAGIRLADRLVHPIKALNEQVRTIAQGAMERNVTVPDSEDELESLAVSFNVMLEKLREYMGEVAAHAAEKERNATELEIAAHIQGSMLPGDFLRHCRGCSLYAMMKPCREVGGDFYDFFFWGEHHLAAVIGDVSGKGVPAAMFMAVARTTVKNSLLNLTVPEDLPQAIANVNNQLCEGNEESMFVTLFALLLDLRDGKMVYVNAGHSTPLVIGQKISVLQGKHGCPLGIMENCRFPLQEWELEPGDTVLLYTDGVTEAMNEKQELYGIERLKAVAGQLSGKKISAAMRQNTTADAAKNEQEACYAQTLLDAILADVKHYAGQELRSDDITMVAVQYEGEKY